MMTIVTDRDRLDSLRRRLAAAERVTVIQRIQGDINIFAEGAAESMLLEISDLQDRCAAKAERLGGPAAPKQSRKLQCLQQAAHARATDRNAAM
jgi:hypothetical protein